MTSKVVGKYQVEGNAVDAYDTSYPCNGELSLYPNGTCGGHFYHNTEFSDVTVIPSGTWSETTLKFELYYGADTAVTYKYFGQFSKGSLLKTPEINGEWQLADWPNLRPNSQPPNERGIFKIKLKPIKGKEPKAEGETKTKSPEKQKARAARSGYENPDTTAAEQDSANGATTSTALDGGKGTDIVLDKGGRSKKFNYIVHVLTSPEDDSGTDARVHLTLSGKGGSSQPLALDITNCVSNNTTLFQEGQIDTFRVQAPTNLGQLTQITIRHDATGFDPSWQVQWIVVVEWAAKLWSMFPCQCWLDPSVPNGVSKQTVPIHSVDIKAQDKLRADLTEALALVHQLKEEKETLEKEGKRMQFIVSAAQVKEQQEAEERQASADKLTKAEEALRQEAERTALQYRKAEEVREEHERLEDDVRSWQKKQQDVQDNIEKLKQAIVELEKQQQEMIQWTADTECTTTEITAKMEAAKIRQQGLQQQMDAMQKTYNTQNEAEVAKISKAEADLAQSKSDLEELERRKKQAVADNKVKLAEVTELETELEVNKVRVSKRGEKLEELLAELRDLNEKVASCEKSLGATGQVLSTKSMELEGLQSQCAEKEKLKEEAAEKLAEWTSALHSLLAEQQTVEDNCRGAQARMDHLTQRIEHLVTHMTEAKKELPALEKEAGYWMEAYAEMSSRYHSAKSLHDETWSNVSRLLGEARDLLELNPTAYVLTNLEWDRHDQSLSQIMHKLVAFRERLDRHSNMLLHTTPDRRLTREERSAIGTLNCAASTDDLNGHQRAAHAPGDDTGVPARWDGKNGRNRRKVPPPPSPESMQGAGFSDFERSMYNQGDLVNSILERGKGITLSSSTAGALGYARTPGLEHINDMRRSSSSSKQLRPSTAIERDNSEIRGDLSNNQSAYKALHGSDRLMFRPGSAPPRNEEDAHGVARTNRRH